METNKKILGQINTQRCSVTLIQLEQLNILARISLDYSSMEGVGMVGWLIQ
jgi:hypothetical protein